MIMLTGLADQALVGAAIALDADSFVVKPIPKNTLDAHVRKILAGKRGAKAPDAYLRTDTSVVAPRKEIASVNSTAVSPSDLRTGDVLAAPLRTRNGALLLPAESALTEAIIARISELFAAGLHDGKIEIRLGPA
jgi:DNA-binding NarL/FixJ family response regulator